jgi:YHS domain-containing protein
MPTRRPVLLALAAAAATLSARPAAAAEKPVSTGWFSDLAVSGHDPVAYFEEGRPVEGSRSFEHKWNGATWRFASARNRDAFAAAPERYAPQYGGYCAWAIAQGYTASADPKQWTIVDGRLYLNYDAEVNAKWKKDVPGFIASADRHWPRIVGK